MSRGRRVMITELLILFMMMVFVTVVITQALVVSRSRSLRAATLTEAVILAENTAEAASSADTSDELRSALESLYEGSEVSIRPSDSSGSQAEESGEVVDASSDGYAILSSNESVEIIIGACSLDSGKTGGDSSSDPTGGSENSRGNEPDKTNSGRLYDIEVIRTVDDGSGGRLIEDTINIYGSGDVADEPVYTLSAAHHVREEAGYGS